MNENEYSAVVDRLPLSKRKVYEAIRDHGPLDDHKLGALIDPAGTSGFRARRKDLVRMGLVRAVGKAERRTIWALTPPSEVEAARETDKESGMRLRPLGRSHPLDVRVSAFLRLADDPEVQDAINDPEGSAKRRQRSRLKSAVARNARDRRERERELRDAIERQNPSAEAMRFRNALRDASDLIRALRALHEEELERRTLVGEHAVPDGEWERVLRAIELGIRHHEEAYEVVARMIGAPSRLNIDVELAEEDVIEEAEYELISALGKDVSETP
jgi:hypothetical protein